MAARVNGDPRSLSLWHDTAGEDWTPRPALPADRDADVAIVGAGFTGLWTAYYLSRADPSLRIVVLEREVAGFGASGRNGGWCSALFPASMDWLASRHGRGAALAQHRAMQGSVDEVGAAAEREGIECSWVKGGTVVLARTPVQLERARQEVADARRWGLGVDDLELLGADAARERLGASDALGATYTPHCAAIHPARLVRGLARTVERLGVTVHESTPVLRIDPGTVTTGRGRVRAGVVVRATEGYTSGLPGLRRVLAPVYSLMIATEPLPEEVWARIGLRQRETFSDHRHLIVYGQRTADGRVAFGGRGAPYHFGSRVRPEHDREPDTFAALRRVLVEMLPQVEGAAITHTWGGPLGIPRDWCASVGLDRRTGLAWAGGYVGDGVATTNLAGRTLADLVLERSTELTALPWVGHRSPRWEPEPLRWLGVSAAL
ncbi:MAG: FAD-binding oxidoreductase, partial [Spirochaetaceae bacterium]|nr:FAD-binding oxidoreductase [Spirochaetaceae bacterium]